MVKITQIKPENYIVIQGWMITNLNLKGNDLIVYAIIYGYCQNGNGKFIGSRNYLKEWTGCGSLRTIDSSLHNLIERGLIEKEETYKDGIKTCSYQCKNCTGVVQKVTWVGAKIAHNNIDNNIDININTITTNKESIFEYIEKNFMRTLSPIEYELIKTWEDNELTRYVIKKAVLNQKYNLNYIDKILYEMKKKGITTVQQAQQSDEEFQKNKNNKIYKTIQTTPEWYNKKIELQEMSNTEQKEIENILNEIG